MLQRALWPHHAPPPFASRCRPSQPRDCNELQRFKKGLNCLLELDLVAELLSLQWETLDKTLESNGLSELEIQVKARGLPIRDLTVRKSKAKISLNDLNRLLLFSLATRTVYLTDLSSLSELLHHTLLSLSAASAFTLPEVFPVLSTFKFTTELYTSYRPPSPALLPSPCPHCIRHPSPGKKARQQT